MLADVPGDARVLREEIFGPDRAGVRASTGRPRCSRGPTRCDQGLAAYLHTRDLDRAMRVGEALEVGMVAVNRGRVSSVAAPFGGVKQSGFGRAGGADALADYLDTRYLTIPR